MKTILSFVLLFALTINSSGQASIRIFTKLDDSKFKILINGEVENTIPIREVTFDSLDYKKPHLIVINFGVDSVADIESEIYLLKDQKREFEILKKKEILRKSAKVGRKIGKFLRVGKHDKEAILYDVFYLEERTKSEYMNN